MATATFLHLLLTVAIFTSLTSAQHRNSETLSEIQALTSFKRSLQDPLGALDGWDSSSPLAPCDWRGIVCFQNRVQELRLPRLHLAGRLSEQLGYLRELRKLSLHSNNFNGSIPSSLSQCALLRAVYLQYNSFSGKLTPAILNLTNLQILNVAHNLLSGELSNDISPSLRYLDVSSNELSGEVPANFSVNSQLQLINLSFNRFSGEVPASIGKLQMLEYLWLDSNQLYGTLPSAITNCSSLIHLSAEDNQLRGVVPATIGLIPRLQVLSLSRNELSGLVPVSLFCSVPVNGSSLRILQLGFNALTGFVKPPNEKCKSILEVLILKENHIHGKFPSWLTNVTTLRVLDLSGNFLSGSLPTTIDDFVRLEELNLANNSLVGEIPSGIIKCSLLKVLDLDGNQFSGKVPSFLGDLRSLRMLSIGRNLVSGIIPVSIGKLSELEILNLNNNKLFGKVPEELMQLSNLSTLNLSNNRFSGQFLWDIGKLKNLQVLNLSDCGFSGRFPSSIGSLMKLTTLDLSKQKLSGNLPIEIFGLPNLQVVALQENLLSGDVPEGFSSLVSLKYLNLSFNSFSSNIPTTFGFLKSLVFLSLSSNRISGQIPTEIGNCSDLQVLELRSNTLRGNIPSDISHLSYLQKLDLGENELKDQIPEEISNCSSLISLFLDVNQLSGQIPATLSKLSNLTVLNLSSNRLNGTIPVNISIVPRLKYLNLSSNNLEGEIPKAIGLRFNDSFVFVKNPKLCGKPLDTECAYVKRRKRRKLILIIGISLAGAFVLAMCCCGYIFSLLRWRKRLKDGVTGEKKRSPAQASTGAEGGRGSGENGGGPKLVMFNNKITLAETLEATRHFDEENVLSRGKYGLVFKASYLDGMVFSIRRFSDCFVDEGSFRKEAESLGKIKHRNITILRGYYAGPPDLRLLVYDYMPNGNLATLLQEASHQDGHVLNWPMRHLIALGIARGLAFLHSVSMVHGDLKPQNVLFDADFEAHLSEFGLDRLSIKTTPAEASTSSTPVGSLGYVSPEAALTGQVTKESDVYGYGIVLLEILTGKNPLMFTQDEDIVKWVKRQLQRGQISELLEPGLLELDPESSEWEEFLLGVKVGLLCTAPDPIDRPSMADIVFMLEGCRVGSDLPSSADPTSLPSPI